MNQWITCHHPAKDACLRLFCFPYAGGGAQVFHAWRRLLPPTIEVCPVQLPGRGSRIGEPAFTDLSPLIEVLGKALLPWLDRPFAFFGYSMGAVLAFELTRWLRRAGRSQPVHLIVAAHGAPHLPRTCAPISRLSRQEFLEGVLRYNGIAAELLAEEELMELMLPTLRADFSLLESYSYYSEPPLACSITAFGGWQDASVGFDQLQAWEAETATSFFLHMFPGDHFFLDSQQPLLLKVLQRQMIFSINRQPFTFLSNHNGLSGDNQFPIGMVHSLI
ncbi:MAG: alpha/beta fold hydrolase [Candidatus Competibacteraceae bacterium]